MIAPIIAISKGFNHVKYLDCTQLFKGNGVKCLYHCRRFHVTGQGRYRKMPQTSRMCQIVLQSMSTNSSQIVQVQMDEPNIGFVVGCDIAKGNRNVVVTTMRIVIQLQDFKRLPNEHSRCHVPCIMVAMRCCSID